MLKRGLAKKTPAAVNTIFVAPLSRSVNVFCYLYQTTDAQIVPEFCHNK